jgi:hypothetical protein
VCTHRILVLHPHHRLACCWIVFIQLGLSLLDCHYVSCGFAAQQEIQSAEAHVDRTMLVYKHADQLASLLGHQ